MHTRHRERGSRRRKLCSSEEDAFSRLVECDSPPWPTDCRPKASSSTRPSPRPPSSQPAVFNFGLTSAGIFRRPRIYASPYTCYSRIHCSNTLLEIVSRWYRIDASGMWLKGAGGSSMDAVFDVIIEYGIERGEEIRGRKLIFEHLDIDFDIGERREFWIIVIDDIIIELNCSVYPRSVILSLEITLLFACTWIDWIDCSIV